VQPIKTTRLDIALVQRGLVPSRSRARDFINRGYVDVDGAPALKTAMSVTAHSVIRLQENAPRYVSRGAEKLAAALDHFKFSVSDRHCLDVGASTGGFTDVLLERGARRVVAVDVGHGQLDASLRQRPEVVNLEGVDARHLSVEKIGGRSDAIVIDVSFISLLKILPSVLPLMSPSCWCIALVKPQFEVGPAYVGKGGIVSNEAAREAALRHVLDGLAENQTLKVCGTLPSPIPGGSGNREYLVGVQQRV